MVKKILIIGIIILILSANFGSSFANTHQLNPITFRNTLYVGGTGPNNYTSIQDAIDDASEGDTVFVYDDSSPYWENILIDKTINLLGENKNTTEIISNWEKFYVINISSDYVNLSGFTIESDGFDRYGSVGISIVSSNNKISDIIIEGGYDIDKGLELLGSSKNNIIIGNIFIAIRNGIYSSFSSNNTIENNTFSNNWNCILLDPSHGNKIINNILNDNEHGIILYNSHNNILFNNKLYNDAICTTLYLKSSNNNTIKNNTIFWGNSISIRFSHNNTITENTIAHCWYGISLWNTSYNEIFCNNFISCDYGILSGSYFNENCKNDLKHLNCCNTQNFIMPNIENNFWYSIHGNNTFYHNNFINNSQNAKDNLDNIWDDDYPSGGNYWDDYSGYDNDGDGIGDTPYPIPGGENIDRYPFMEQFGKIPNLPPYPPHNCFPCWQTIYGDVNLSWNGGDPDSKDMVSYDVYFGTHNPPPLIETIGPYPANQTRIHYYLGSIECRKYYWKIVAWDGFNIKIDGPTCYFEKKGCNYPPTKPEIDGPSTGKVGVNCWTFHTTDVDDDNLFYYIDWGDETFTDWLGPFDSCEPIEICHTYKKTGHYSITAKAKDINGNEGEWSDPFSINIPRNRAIENSCFQWFFNRFPMLERLVRLIIR